MIGDKGMVWRIDDIRVNIYQHGENGPCFYVGESDREAGSVDNFAARLAKEAGNTAYTLVVYEVTDWNSQLSPWSARAAFGEEMFAGRGADTLAWLTDKCIPQLREEGLTTKGVPQYTAGYSLSGLYALWAFLESDLFDGAVSCSGSLWIDGWMDYIMSAHPKGVPCVSESTRSLRLTSDEWDNDCKLCSHYIRRKDISRDALIYLSLGSKEERTKNPLMSAVGDRTRETYECLKKNPAVKKIALQWNKGGHFADADARLIKGILWILQAQRSSEKKR